MQVELAWVPSHGKKKTKFQPAEGLSEEFMRSMNNKADEAATAVLQRAIRRTGRGRWEEEAKEARKWAAKALHLAVEVGEEFEAWVSSCLPQAVVAQ